MYQVSGAGQARPRQLLSSSPSRMRYRSRDGDRGTAIVSGAPLVGRLVPAGFAAAGAVALFPFAAAAVTFAADAVPFTEADAVATVLPFALEAVLVFAAAVALDGFSVEGFAAVFVGFAAGVLGGGGGLSVATLIGSRTAMIG